LLIIQKIENKDHISWQDTEPKMRTS